MSFASEGVSALSPGNEVLAGTRQLSLDQTVVFRRYTRKVLPLDGFVFWLADDVIEVSGVLHVTSDLRQEEDQTLAVQRVTFTAGKDVQRFMEVDPSTMWVGQYQTLRFAFVSRRDFIRSAGVYTYSGDAVYPALASQLVETGAQLSDRTLVVSDSLPMWLSLVDFYPIWLPVPNPRVTLFPAFLSPQNLEPPYGTVHVEPMATRALSSAPLLDRRAGQTQLAADRVKVTLYGLTNEQAQSFLLLVDQFTLPRGTFGMTGMPIVRDMKRPQAEIGVLAMKKEITFEVSYLQGAARDLARKLITKACYTLNLPNCHPGA